MEASAVPEVWKGDEMDLSFAKKPCDIQWRQSRGGNRLAGVALQCPVCDKNTMSVSSDDGAPRAMPGLGSG